MSNLMYDIMWREGIMELLDQLEAENPDDSILAPKDLAEWSCVYIKYLQIYQKLESAYDQIIHPQKRVDIKTALEGCMGRMLEIRHFLVELNNGLDFINLDDILVDLKLTPEIIEVPVPRYFREDRKEQIRDQEEYLKALIKKFKGEAEISSDSPQSNLHLEIERIQEEDRQTQEAEDSLAENRSKEDLQLETDHVEDKTVMDEYHAAMIIQAATRGMQWRRKIREEEQKELVFIEMKPKCGKERDPENDPVLIEAKNLKRRKDIQKAHQQGYEKALEELKGKVELMEGQEIRETIQDKINAWFVENRDPLTGEYPTFPQDGGSKTILEPAPKSSGPAEEPDETAKSPRHESSSQFICDLEEAVKVYVGKWQDRDEQENFSQQHDVELVKEELRPKVFEEVRQQVDSEVAIMLENLKEMLASEREAKGKKGGKKGGKGKKKKGKGDKKGKKKKDLTADRTIESLYSELVSEEIVKPVNKYQIKDYLGMFNCLGATLEKAGNIPDPSMAQIRQLLTECFVLPLGSQYLHTRLPCLKTVLLYGYPSTGKTMLAHAIANSTGAHFFDLSPRNTDGKYLAKQVSLLIHMVFKVAKIMAPSVIYIDECEKVFVTDKKKSKEFGGTEAFSRIKKDLLKEVKSLTAEDRVLVIGNSFQPQLCIKKEEKAFIQFWDKHVFLPLPDYASRRVLWTGLFENYGAPLPYEFDLSTLAHLSRDFASGTIHQVVKTMLTTERMGKLFTKPLTVEEIMTWLSMFHKVSIEEEDALQSWALKLPNRGPGSQENEEKKEAAKEKKEKRK